MTAKTARIIGSATKIVLWASAAAPRKAAAMDEIAEAARAANAGRPFICHLNAALDILG